MRIPAVLLIIWLMSLVGLPAESAAVAARLRTPAELVDAAALFASRLDPKTARYARFVSFATVADLTARGRQIQALGLVLNSLSTNDLIALPVEVPGTDGALLWFDASQLRDRNDAKGLKQLLQALDRLGEKGSGPAPFPEPYFHAIISEEYEEASYREAEFGYWSGEKWVKVETRKVPTTTKRKRRTVALSPALNKATAAGLALVTNSNFPIFRHDWFFVNALVEPAYHALLGLDDSLASAKRLAAVDEKTADRVGAQTRGAVLFSPVAIHNRVLERTPTAQKYGRGSFHLSYDFATSIDDDDVMRDLLVKKAAAFEVIWTLPNGLQGWYVADGQGKRLNNAAANVAARRRGWNDPQVYTGYSCLDCHFAERGYIEVDDEARQASLKQLALASQAVDLDGDRGKRVRQRYLGIDFNELLRADQMILEAAVKTATAVGGRPGLTAAEARREVIGTIKSYLQDPVTAPALAREYGVSELALMKAMETPGLLHVFPGLRTLRKQRRDQTEVGFSALGAVLQAKGWR